MAERIPTQRGDVLIVMTDKAFTVYVVGRVSKDGQEDFHAHMDMKYEGGLGAAVAQAKALVVPGRRIILRNLDTGQWSEITK